MSWIAALMWQAWTRHRTLLALLALVAAPACMVGAETPYIDEATYDSVAGRATSGGPSAVGASAAAVIGVLALIIGMVVGLGLLLRRLGTHRRLLLPQGDHAKVLETLPLGLKRSIAVLRVDGRLVLIGNSEHGLHALGVLEPLAPVLPARTVDPTGAPQPSAAHSPAEETRRVSEAVLEPRATEMPALSIPPDPEAAVGDFRSRLARLLGGGRS